MGLRYDFFVTGYVDMPEHVHLLVSEPKKAILAKALQALKLSVAVQRRERSFWQARYYDFNVYTVRKRVEKLRYMHRNPVARGFDVGTGGLGVVQFSALCAGELGAVEIESPWTAARRGSCRRGSPRLNGETWGTRSHCWGVIQIRATRRKLLCGGSELSGLAIGEWMAIVSRLNSIVLKTDRWRDYVMHDALSTGWCGLPPALESETVRAEGRLGVKLPPSYRSFLSISNGWRPFSSFIERLVPVQELERYGTVDPEDAALLQHCYQEDDVSDEDYLDYGTPEHMVALRHRYFPGSLLVGTKWDGGGGGELLLLNPHITFPNGEWEAIFFANWIPGNQRYPSFLEFVKESVGDLERIEQSAGGTGLS